MKFTIIKMKEFLRTYRQAPFLVVIFLIFLYSLVFSYFSINRLNNLHAHYYDLGIMDQVVYNTARGRILTMTHPDLAVIISRFAIHFDPIMALLAPFYLIHQTPVILLVAQSIILALGAWAVFLIAKKVLVKPWLAALFAFLYLNYYPMQLANLFDFHAVTFATTGLLFAFYFLAMRPLKSEKNNDLMGLILVLISLLAKENVSLLVVFLSVYLYFRHKKRKFYIILGAGSAVLFLFIAFQVIPFYNSASSFAMKYYDFRYPLALLRQLFSLNSIKYLLTVLYPLGFISLFAPVALLIAAPEFLLILLSANSNMRQMYFHYTALILPFVIISAIYGFNRLQQILPAFPKKIPVLAILLLAVSIFTTYRYAFKRYPLSRVNRQTLATVLYWRDKLADDQIKVASTGSIAPFFTEREYFYHFFFDPAYKQVGISPTQILANQTKYEKADYIIIRKSDVNLNDKLKSAYYNALKQNSAYQQVDDRNGIEVYVKNTRGYSGKFIRDPSAFRLFE